MDIRVIGMMSGSSLDGLDIADCTFSSLGNSFSYFINTAQTLEYPEDLKKSLTIASSLSSIQLTELNKQYSSWISEQLNNIIEDKDSIQLIGLHGHTVFHEPKKGFSLQLGDGAIISSKTNIATVTDFRNADIAAGGQGAPLSPKGDLDLFSEYDGFLNLGGISNFSFKMKDDSILGYDICPFNLALNELAERVGLNYDKDGKLASKGVLIESLFEELNSIPFYADKKPKSIDRIWYEKEFQPILKKYYNSSRLEDIIHSVCQHQKKQIADVLNYYLSEGKQILFSGGGTNNSFFIESLKSQVKAEIIIPETEIVDYKEAIIFAYLALLRALNKTNCIAKVTGAEKDSIGGELFGNWNLNTN